MTLTTSLQSRLADDVQLCDAVIEYLGPTVSALQLGMCCRWWHQLVVTSSVWRQLMAKTSVRALAECDTMVQTFLEEGHFSRRLPWLDKVHEARAIKLRPVKGGVIPEPSRAKRFARFVKSFLPTTAGSVPDYTVALMGYNDVDDIMHYIRHGREPEEVESYVGFAFDHVVYRGVMFQALPFGQVKTRPLCRSFVEQVQVILFTLDADAPLDEWSAFQSEMNFFIRAAPANAAVCIVAHGQEDRKALSPSETAQFLQLDVVLGNARPWCVFGAIHGQTHLYDTVIEWIIAAATST